MLVLTRFVNQSLIIDNSIWLTLIAAHHRNFKIHLTGPRVLILKPGNHWIKYERRIEIAPETFIIGKKQEYEGHVNVVFTFDAPRKVRIYRK